MDPTVAAPSFVTTAQETPFESVLDIGFYHGLVASLSVIIVSELGDKTWFIAAIMAMRHSRIAVFFGAMAALTLMTVLSGMPPVMLVIRVMLVIVPHKITFYVSTALFALFGLKMLHEGYHMCAYDVVAPVQDYSKDSSLGFSAPGEGQEEYEEAQAEVQKTDLDVESTKYVELESGTSRNTESTTWKIISFVSTIFVKSFTLTFLAEWGDRSQLTTIILGAREDVAGVCIGGVLGHAICTGIAVIGGRLLAQRISVRSVTLIGGVVFLLFALSAFFIDKDEAG